MRHDMIEGLKYAVTYNGPMRLGLRPVRTDHLLRLVD